MDRASAFLCRAALALSILLAPAAWAADDLAIELEAFRVVTAADGGQRLEPTDAARPGEVIEYRVTYTNRGEETLGGIRGVLPIPEATVYQPTTAQPAMVEASVDGRRYGQVPLREPVTGPDGETQFEPVAVSRYRYLRWSLGDLEPGASTTARARVAIPLRTADAAAE